MLHKLIIRRFKAFRDVEIELGQAVVLVGPNNSGKTTALQALALWELGVRRWSEKRTGKALPRQRSGVTLNRRDLVALPVPETNLLWRGLHVREVTKVGGKQKTENIRIDIEVHGIDGGTAWKTGIEFDYANPESIYCRPLGWANNSGTEGDPISEAARSVRIAYLPPMSGLMANEVRLDQGAIQVRLGEGRTAEVLRNLCHSLVTGEGGAARWQTLTDKMSSLFGVALNPPEYVVERGELIMSYSDQNGIRLDLSAAGRGLQQTLLLLAFLMCNPGSVLLLDEPDAHLEILRQQQIYNALTEVAASSGSQIIAASHSEAILNEAADRDVVVAFVGKPHRIDDRGSQLMKSLKSIGYEQYYMAESAGWVLYLEGATDLAILRALARTLGHPAAALLERPFAHYVANKPSKAKEHFYGIREAKPDLVGIAVFDSLDREAVESPDLEIMQWPRREIENYLCFPSVLEDYAAALARARAGGPLFEETEIRRFRDLMTLCITERVPPAALSDPSDLWWTRTKASDDFLDPLFERFFQELQLPNLMHKTDYHRLAEYLVTDQIHDDVRGVLDKIVEIAQVARPVSGATEA